MINFKNTNSILLSGLLMLANGPALVTGPNINNLKQLLNDEGNRLTPVQVEYLKNAECQFKIFGYKLWFVDPNWYCFCHEFRSRGINADASVVSEMEYKNLCKRLIEKCDIFDEQALEKALEGFPFNEVQVSGSDQVVSPRSPVAGIQGLGDLSQEESALLNSPPLELPEQGTSDSLVSDSEETQSSEEETSQSLASGENQGLGTQGLDDPIQSSEEQPAALSHQPLEPGHPPSLGPKGKYYTALGVVFVLGAGCMAYKYGWSWFVAKKPEGEGDDELPNEAIEVVEGEF